MTWKTACLYLKNYTRTDFSDCCALFGEYGILLTNPRSKCVTKLTEEGAQVVVEAAHIYDCIASKQPVSFQWWVNSGVDIYCRIRFAGNGAAMEYGLDGLGEYTASVETVLEAYFNLLVQKNMIEVFYIDYWGVTEHFDWDAFACDRTHSLENLPAVLGIPIGRLSQCGVDYSEWEQKKLGNMLLLKHLGKAR
jgi:hypothetical protein